MRELHELEMREVMRALGMLPPDPEPDLATRLFLDLSGTRPDFGLGHVTHTDVAPGGRPVASGLPRVLPPLLPGRPRG